MGSGQPEDIGPARSPTDAPVTRSRRRSRRGDRQVLQKCRNGRERADTHHPRRATTARDEPRTHRETGGQVEQRGERSTPSPTGARRRTSRGVNRRALGGGTAGGERPPRRRGPDTERDSNLRREEHEGPPGPDPTADAAGSSEHASSADGRPGANLVNPRPGADCNMSEAGSGASRRGGTEPRGRKERRGLAASLPKPAENGVCSRAWRHGARPRATEGTYGPQVGPDAAGDTRERGPRTKDGRTKRGRSRPTAAMPG